MGRKKNLIREGIQESKDVGNEGLEKGQELSMDSEEIRALIDSIDTDMDDDDVQMIDSTKEGYEESFSGAFKEEVLEKKKKMEKIGEKQIEQSNEEIERVSQAADIYESIERVSDIGSKYAERAKSKMERSKSEYEEMVEDTKKSMEEIQSHIAELENNIERVFR